MPGIDEKYNTVLYMAQLLIPPVYQAVMWNGRLECLQSLERRFNLGGYIGLDDSLEISNPQTWRTFKVPTGKYLVFQQEYGLLSLKEVINYDDFINKYKAWKTGVLSPNGVIEPFLVKS